VPFFRNNQDSLKGKERNRAQEYSRNCIFGILHSARGPQALNNDAVIKLVKAGLSEDLIVTTSARRQGV